MNKFLGLMSVILTFQGIMAMEKSLQKEGTKNSAYADTRIKQEPHEDALETSIMPQTHKRAAFVETASDKRRRTEQSADKEQLSATESGDDDENGLQAKLFQAIRSADSLKLIESLDQGAGVNAKNRAGDTALHVAVRGSSPQRTLLVTELIKRGADIWLMNTQGETVYKHADPETTLLINTLIKEREERSSALSRQKSTLVTANPPQATTQATAPTTSLPMIAATTAKKPSGAAAKRKAPVSKKAPVQVQGSQLAQPEPNLKEQFFSAISHGNLSQLQTILAQGTSHTLIDVRGLNILQAAVYYDKLPIVQWLAATYPELIDIPVAGTQSHSRLPVRPGGGIGYLAGDTILHMAAVRGNLALMIWLSQNYPRLVDGVNQFQMSAFDTAVYNGQLEAVKYFAHIYPHLITRPSADGMSVLQIAALSGFESTFEWIEKKFPSLKTMIAADGSTILHTYVRQRVVYPSKTRDLLKSCKNLIGTKNNEGNTFLHEAIFYSSDEVISQIVDYCPSLFTIKNNAQETPQELARRLNKLGLAETLKHAEEKQLRGASGPQPLSSAQRLLWDELVASVRNGDLSQIQSLINQGASPQWTDQAGHNLLQHAIATKQLKVAQWLVRTYPELMSQLSVTRGGSIVHFAIEQGDMDSVILLVQSNPALVDSVDNTGISIFDRALLSGKLAIAKYLASAHPALIERTNKKWGSVLQVAVYGGYQEIIEWLFNIYEHDKAPVSATGKNSLLHRAAYSAKCSLATMRWLAERCETNLFYERNIKGNTILHAAVERNRIEIVQWIAEQYPLLLTIKNNEQETPLESARKLDHIGCIEILRIAQEKQTSNASNSVMPGKTPSVVRGIDIQGSGIAPSQSTTTMSATDLGLVSYFDVNIRVDGKTILHSMLSQGTVIVQKLLERGADINAQDNDGNSPLMKAIEAGNEELARMLIVKDAQVNIQNNYGETALILAAKKGLLPLITLLIEKNANAAVQDQQGKKFTAYLDPSIRDLIGMILTKQT